MFTGAESKFKFFKRPTNVTTATFAVLNINKVKILLLSICHFLSHAQNKVRVSVGELTRFVNMTDWMKKVKISIITEKG